MPLANAMSSLNDCFTLQGTLNQHAPEAYQGLPILAHAKNPTRPHDARAPRQSR